VGLGLNEENPGSPLILEECGLNKSILFRTPYLRV